MGVGRQFSLHEIDDTRAASREEDFEKIIERVKANKGEITKDEQVPLYDEIGTQEFELGKERIVEFNMKGMDFRLIRRVEEKRISGSGHQKHLEELSPPRIKISMKRKSQYEDDWQIVDFEELL